jgi:IclR family acetate operon transcriptional repressor
MSVHGGESERKQGIQVIARAAAILAALERAEDGLTLTELAAIVAMPRSTVHRIAASLESEGLVIGTPRGVLRLGPRLVSLARATRWHLGDAARPHIVELSRRVEETVELGVLQGSNLLLVDQVVARRRLRTVSTIGARVAAHATAGGKVLLALETDTHLKTLLPARLERFTPSTITSRADLMAQLATIRKLGVAFDHAEESEGISAVALVISDASGDRAAVTISGPSQRIEEREQGLAAALRGTASGLSAALQAAVD